MNVLAENVKNQPKPLFLGTSAGNNIKDSI